MSRAIHWGRWTLLSWLFVSRLALAAPEKVHLIPTEVQAHGAPVSLLPQSRNLDALLSEAVRDFELIPLANNELSWEKRTDVGRERSLVALAKKAWVVAPQLILGKEGLWVRIVAIAPGSETLWTRSVLVQDGALAVRTLGLLRELLSEHVEPSTESLNTGNRAMLRPRPYFRSSGRAILAVHSAALGGYLGVALQRASGSTDVRLAYPLATLGAGVGLAAAVVVAEEWDITQEDAWYLGAAAFWPTVATLLLVKSSQGSPREDRHLLGLLSAAGGLTLATAGLSQGEVNYGGAVLTHSGALFGMLLGGLSERALAGDAAGPSQAGMGYGALAGLAVSGALASQFEVPSASDLLFIDLSAVLGGLAAAALGTPFLISEKTTKLRERLWLGGVMLGTIAGGAIGYSATQGAEEQEPGRRAIKALQRSEGLQVRPLLGGVGQDGFGLGLLGTW